MSKIELTISPEYVPSWTYIEAMRELFQNAYDQERQNPDNVASWSYSPETSTFTISNKTSKLTAASLLLGHTTKSQDKATIGQFGEGYKIATLVLLREGKTITFYNYGAKEIWRPRFVKSRRFGTDILTFFTEKSDGLLKRSSSADLVIEIEGITPDEVAKIRETNLHMRNDVKVIEETEYGRVIDKPGLVFVNGLYICKYEPYKYGYDFKPEYVKLDRDRKLISDFDLCWLASRLWSDCKNNDIVLDMIAKSAADVRYIGSISWTRIWSDRAYDEFLNMYGCDAVPVATQEEYESLPCGYKGIIVDQQYYSLLIDSSHYTKPTLANKSDKPIAQLLTEWLNGVRYHLTNAEVEAFKRIVAKISPDLTGEDNEEDTEEDDE